MLVTLRKLVDDLLVYPENMARNMDLTRGLWASQSLLLLLTTKGLERKDAYEAVQRAAMQTWQGNGSLAQNLASDPRIATLLSTKDIEAACLPDRHFAHVDAKLRALGILEPPTPPNTPASR
jgi:adenylosuccinate lyase